MNLFDLFAKISLDTTEYDRGVKGVSDSSKKIADKFTKVAKSSETVENKIKVLASQYSAAKSDVAKLTDAFNKSAKENGYAADETQQLARELKDAENKAEGLKSELNKLQDSAKGAGDRFSGIISKLQTGLAPAAKIAAAGIGAVSGAATGGVAALLSLEQSTEEYRIAQGKLNTAFESAGYNVGTAKQAYSDFYAILGDTDTATEASQLLAKLANNAEDMSVWTNIAAGVYGTFGDSLPIEGLIESSNETAKVGQVTGVLADALNWAGISEDEFNEKLAACSDETERNELIMDTLSDTYDDASEAFKKNNDQLINARKNQVKLDDSLADLGGSISELKNDLIREFTPALSNVVEAFSDMVSGVKGADDDFQEALSAFVDQALTKLPQFLDLGLTIVESLAIGIVQAAPDIIEAGFDVLMGIVEVVPEIATNLFNAMPDIIAAIVTGLLNGAGSILEAVVSLFSPLVLSADAAAENIQKITESITPFSEVLEQTQPAIANFNDMLSSTGDSISTIDQKVKQTSDAITQILSNALQEGRTLREQEIKEIQEHQETLAKLQAEKLQTSMSQQISIITMAKLKKGELSKEEYSQLIVDAEAAYEQTKTIAYEHYQDRIAFLHNYYQSRGMLNSEAHVAELEQAAADYEENLALADSHNQNLLKLLEERVLTGASLELDTYSKLQGDMEAAYDKSLAGQGDYNLASIMLWDEHNRGMTEEGAQLINTLLGVAAESKAAGGKITEETKKTLGDFLGVFRELPPAVQEQGKQTLLGLIQGLEEYIPELADASEMSAEEIVEAIGEYLEISSPSRVLESLGGNTMLGFIKGIDDKRDAVRASGTAISDRLLGVFRTLAASMYSVGREIGQELLNGMGSMEDRLLSKARRIADKIRDTLDSATNVPASYSSMSRTDSTILGPASVRTGASINLTQNVYAQTVTPVEAFDLALQAQERAVFLNV